MTSRLSDAEFIEHLRAYEEVMGSGVAPIFYSAAGKVKREEVLNLSAFSGMTPEAKRSLL